MNALDPAVDWRTEMRSVRVTQHAKQVQYVEPQEDHTFLSPYFRNHSTSDIGVLGYIGIL